MKVPFGSQKLREYPLIVCNIDARKPPRGKEKEFPILGFYKLEVNRLIPVSVFM